MNDWRLNWDGGYRCGHMASAIGEPKTIVDADMPGKFGSMPTHFFESSWGHYVSKAS